MVWPPGGSDVSFSSESQDADSRECLKEVRKGTAYTFYPKLGMQMGILKRSKENDLIPS